MCSSDNSGWTCSIRLFSVCEKMLMFSRLSLRISSLLMITGRPWPVGRSRVHGQVQKASQRFGIVRDVRWVQICYNPFLLSLLAKSCNNHPIVIIFVHFRVRRCIGPFCLWGESCIVSPRLALDSTQEILVSSLSPAPKTFRRPIRFCPAHLPTVPPFCLISQTLVLFGLLITSRSAWLLLFCNWLYSTFGNTRSSKLTVGHCFKFSHDLQSFIWISVEFIFDLNFLSTIMRPSLLINRDHLLRVL